MESKETTSATTASSATQKGKSPKVLLNTHIDTVPPFFPAEILKIEETDADRTQNGKASRYVYIVYVR